MSEALKETKPRTKLVIRHLPPGMNQDEFMEMIQEWKGRTNYMAFRRGRIQRDAYGTLIGLDRPIYGAVHLNFIEPKECNAFYRQFNDKVVTDSTGFSCKLIVDFALSQGLPVEGVDNPLVGTYQSLPVYIEFIKQNPDLAPKSGSPAPELDIDDDHSASFESPLLKGELATVLDTGTSVDPADAPKQTFSQLIGKNSTVAIDGLLSPKPQETALTRHIREQARLKGKGKFKEPKASQSSKDPVPKKTAQSKKKSNHKQQERIDVKNEVVAKTVVIKQKLLKPGMQVSSDGRTAFWQDKEPSEQPSSRPEIDETVRNLESFNINVSAPPFVPQPHPPKQKAKKQKPQPKPKLAVNDTSEPITLKANAPEFKAPPKILARKPESHPIVTETHSSTITSTENASAAPLPPKKGPPPRKPKKGSVHELINNEKVAVDPSLVDSTPIPKKPKQPKQKHIVTGSTNAPDTSSSAPSSASAPVDARPVKKFQLKAKLQAQPPQPLSPQ